MTATFHAGDMVPLTPRDGAPMVSRMGFGGAPLGNLLAAWINDCVILCSAFICTTGIVNLRCGPFRSLC